MCNQFSTVVSISISFKVFTLAKATLLNRGRIQLGFFLYKYMICVLNRFRIILYIRETGVLTLKYSEPRRPDHGPSDRS